MPELSPSYEQSAAASRGSSSFDGDPSFRLNPAAPTPLYRQLAERFTELIRSGKLLPGAQLPSEPDLARTHGVGRPTIRQATDLLVQRGLVRRRRGSGTYVLERAPSVDVFTLAGTVSSFENRGLELETRLLQPIELRCVEGDERHPFVGREVYCYIRLGRVDKRPVLVEHVFASPGVFPNFAELPIEGASLAQLVRERYGMEPSSGTQTFEVGVGPRRTQRALGLHPTETVLVIRRTLHFPEAPTALHSILYCRTDHVRFTQTIG
jgi:GntR family transcriptional regulator